MNCRSRQSGFSLLELMVVSCLLLIVVSGTYLRYMALVVEAEQAAFKGVVSSLQAGINLRLGEAYSRHRLGQLDQLDNTNPMQLLSQLMVPPNNYLGELSAKEALQAPPAHWYYDLDQRRLVYHVRYTQNTNGLMVENQRIPFRLQARTPLPGPQERQIAGRLRLIADADLFWQSPLGFGRPPSSADNIMELAQWMPQSAP